MKITDEEFKQVKLRHVALNSVQTLFEMARNETRGFYKELMKKYNLDETKEYTFNDDGEILEIKKETIPE